MSAKGEVAWKFIAKVYTASEVNVPCCGGFSLVSYLETEGEGQETQGLLV